MKKVHIQRSLGMGWSLFMKRPWYLLGVTLAMLGLVFLTSSNSSLATALACIAYGGYIAMLLNHHRGGTHGP